jgi:hypothetical protein
VARGGKAIRWAGTRIDANPFHRPRILPELLREDRWRGIRGIMTPGAQAQIHRSCRSGEPNTRERDASCRGDRGQGLALGWLEDTASMITGYPPASAAGPPYSGRGSATRWKAAMWLASSIIREGFNRPILASSSNSAVPSKRRIATTQSMTRPSVPKPTPPFAVRISARTSRYRSGAVRRFGGREVKVRKFYRAFELISVFAGKKHQ